MSNFVRSSKFRHVFADAPKIENSWVGYRLATTTGEQTYIKASCKYFALAVTGGGGPFAVGEIDKPGRLSGKQFQVQGHSSAVLDFDFNPFSDHILASCSDDSTIKIWDLPKSGGLTENITEPMVDIRGHGRKVTLLRWNPTAANTLASCSGDQTVKVWDVESGSEAMSFAGNPELTQELVWDWSGNMLATACKDKHIRTIDGRTGAVGNAWEAHEGSKSVKLAYLGAGGNSPSSYIASVGFTKQSQRELKVWDPRNTAKPLKKQDIDQAAGVIMPFYDYDTQILYLCGKGDGNVRYFEMSEKEPYLFPLAEFRSTTSCKGMCMVPKRGNDIMKCETMKLLKLTPNDGVQMLNFIVPRKSDAFQDDIFPDTPAPKAAHTHAEWMAGSDKTPVLMSLDPSKGGAAAFAGGEQMKIKTVASVSKELAAANTRIAELEALLKANNIAA